MKRIKLLFVSVLSSALLLSSSFPSWAKSVSDVTPSEYIFMTMLQACGIRTSDANGQWLAAYRGYLEATGNTAMLNRLNSYSSLNWGDTASGVDALYNSLKGWLSQSSSYGTDAKCYTLPSSPSPAPDKVSSGTSILSVSFSDVNPIKDAGYDYLFSDVYTHDFNNRMVYARRNIYRPSGTEVFGFVQSSSVYDNKLKVYFAVKDSSQASGYQIINLKCVQTAYYSDNDALAYKNSSAYAYYFSEPDICSAMNYPFKVFSNADDAATYAKTGVANNLFSSDKCSLCWHSESGVNLSLQKTNALEISDTMTLPSSNADAMAAYNNVVGNLPLTTATDRLKACGLTASFDLPYTVEYYKDGNLEKSAKGSVTTLSPTLESLEIESFPGYKLDSETSSGFPFTVSEENNTIKLYYQSYNLPYTVEYYQDGKLSSTVQGEVSSLSPVIESVELSPPSGYNAKAEGLPFTVTEDNNTVKVYYTNSSVDAVLSGVNNTISGLKDFLGPALPLGLGAATAGGSIWTVVKIFKRIASKV